MATKPVHLSWADGWPSRFDVFNEKQIADARLYGATVTPCVAMTPERVEALREAIFELQVSVDAQWSAKDTQPAINTLRVMLDELEG